MEQKFNLNTPTGWRETPGSNHRHIRNTWAAILLWVLALTSCGWSEERELRKQIRWQEKIIRNEQKLEYISYKLRVKIEQRKDWVETYKDLLEKCNADPNNLALKKHTLQVCKEVWKYNKDIQRLAQKELDITIKLDDKRCEPQSKLPIGKVYTDPNYFDYLIQTNWNNQINESSTAYYFDFATEENNWTIENYENDEDCTNTNESEKKETLETLIKN